MTTHEASSSSSSKSKLWNYDVFLSFSGVDTRNGFTDHLHAALKDRGYQAYFDEDDLKRGEEITKELLQAIEASKISIIVFSERYADSRWCLNELVKIMECRDKLGRHVLPIFYHIDPSHVRKQNGVLAQAFKKHKKNIRKEKDDKKREEKRERVKQWRKALREAAELAEEFQEPEEGMGEEKDDKKREAKQEEVKQWGEDLTKAANLSGYHLQITDNRGDGTVAASFFATRFHPIYNNTGRIAWVGRVILKISEGNFVHMAYQGATRFHAIYNKTVRFGLVLGLGWKGNFVLCV